MSSCSQRRGVVEEKKYTPKIVEVRGRCDDVTAATILILYSVENMNMNRHLQQIYGVLGRCDYY